VRLPAAGLVAALALTGCGGSSETSPPPTSSAPAAAAEPRPFEPGDGLAIGISEQNANLLRADAPEAFAPWAQRLLALRPALARVVVDWAGAQPDPSRPADLAQPRDGCARTTPPCAPYAAPADLVRALAAARIPVMAVFYGVPDWAAAKAHGCERPGIEPRSRPITDRGLRAYRALIRQVAELAKEAGADLRWWSVWNEPNGPFFISPQRERCSTDSPPVSVRPYARLARAMRAELDAIGGDRRVVVGELAGVAKAGPRGSGVGEFLGALPRDVLCEADVLAQHEYAELPEDDTEGANPVGEAKRALARRCPGARIPVWITETGIGGPRAGQSRSTGARSLRRQCLAYHRQLLAWHEDPEVQAAIQYTFREDSAFPVGLADAGLTRTYPTYDLLRAWGDRRPADPPPAVPAACHG
jgi:hypothetical protein